MRTLILRLATGALLAGGATPALAHAHLLSATPGSDASAPAPAALTLRFSEGVEPAFSGVAVTGPNGAAVATGTATLAGGDPTRLSVPVTGRLAPGRYRVDWHAAAVDGHKTSGSYGFTVVP